MKPAQKCPECGFLDKMYMGICYSECPKCECSMEMAEIVEIVDWDEVFAPDTKHAEQHI